jgi:tetratricopeptide (TPR) repeat protein
MQVKSFTPDRKSKPTIFESFKAMRIEFNNPEGMELNKRGIECANAGRLQEAEIYFQRAIEVSPNLPLPKTNLANIFIMQFRLQEAEILLKEALIYPHYSESKSDVLYALGNCYQFQGKYQDAIEYYQTIRKVMKFPIAAAEYGIGVCLEALGEWEKALQTYYQAIRAAFSRDMSLTPKIIEQAIERLERFGKETLFVYKPKPIHSTPTPVSENKLQNQETIEILSKKLNLNQPLVFFVGAGVSYPSPTNLPLAGQIVKHLFCMAFELDKEEISRIFNNTNPEKIYEKIASELFSDGKKDDNPILPFEPSFKALKETVGHPAVRFVDTLSEGLPNIHHCMLAHAIKKGYLVITVNFDRKIEEAYSKLFPEEKLKVLVHDNDFLRDIENDAIVEGKLIKIHGTLEDYSTVALTLDQIIKGSNIQRYNRTLNNSISIPNHSDEPAFSKSTLSEAKSLFLKHVLKKSSMVILGYSNSDFYDLRPILESNDKPWRGIRVDHLDNCELIEQINPGQFLLKTDTAKATRYLAEQMGIDLPNLSNNKPSSRWASLFEEWVKRLNLKKGDGLHWLGKLYSMRGKWERAGQLYESAANQYEKINLVEKQLIAEINLDFVRGAMPRKGAARDKSLLKKIQGLDVDKLDMHSKNSYAKVLLNLAGSNHLENHPEVWQETSLLIDQALKLSKELGNPGTLSFAYELKGDLMLAQEKYQNALNYYNEAYRISKEITGDINDLLGVMISLARCHSYLKQEYIAEGFLDQAWQIATKLGNQNWLNRIANAYQRDLKWNSVLHLEMQDKIVEGFSMPDQDMLRKDFQSINESFFHYNRIFHENRQLDQELFKKINHSLDALLQKYLLPPVASYLRFVKSNFLVWHLKQSHKIETKNIPKELNADIEQLMENIETRHYDRAEEIIDSLLMQVDLSIRVDLLLIKASLYHRQNLWSKEIETLLECQGFIPDDALVAHNLGVAYVSLDDYINAEKHLLKAIKLLDGYYPLAIYNLCLTYSDIGETERAKQQRKNLIDIGIPDSWLDDLNYRIKQ